MKKRKKKKPGEILTREEADNLIAELWWESEYDIQLDKQYPYGLGKQWEIGEETR